MVPITSATVNSGVYAIVHVATGKRYVGSSMRLRTRWNEHKRRLRRRVHHSILLQRAWDKYGEASFAFEVLECCAPIRKALEDLEQMYLDQRAELSVRRKAVSGYCSGHTEAAKKKIGASHKGNKYAAGHKVTEEMRARMSAARRGKAVGNQNSKGYIPSQETREKMRAARLKIWANPDFRRQVSLKMMGNTNARRDRGPNNA